VISAELPGGLSLRVARMGRLPLVTVGVVVDAGEALLPDGRAGLAVLAGMGLEGGTARRSGPELAEALEGIGTSLSVHTDWDATTVSLTCLVDRLSQAVELLAEALLQPSFPAEEVERLQNQRLAAIRQRRMDPSTLADDAAAHFFFSDAVPYHRPLAGTPGSVEALGPDEVRAFAAGHYRPARGGLVVVGEVQPEQAEAHAQRWFGDWRGAGPASPDFPEQPRSRERRIVVVDRPGAVQSEIRIGQVGAPHTTPHYFPLEVLNTVLGGAFTSRLMLNLREKRGFTYGARSHFALRRKAGPFVASAAVGTEVTAPAVAEALGEIEALVEEGPTAREVDQARDFITGVFPLRLETTGQVATRISELLVYGLPDEFFHDYRDHIRGVSPAAARAAAQAVLRPAEMVVVVVGDAGQVRAPLEELGVGPVEVASLF
jgi:predicted Zn-dependent peptidase